MLVQAGVVRISCIPPLAQCLYHKAEEASAFAAYLGCVLSDGGDLGAGRCRSDVDHDDLILGKLGYLSLLSVCGSDAKKSSEEIEVNFNLAVDIGQTTLQAKHMSDQTIGSAKSRINAGTNANQAAWNGVLQVVEFRV
jgi:hypothetical protein